MPADARIEKLADGFVFIEGPVWIGAESRLLFSDVRGNAIHQWSAAAGASPFIEPVFEGDPEGLALAGSNGLTLDAEGRLVICEHGNRRISRVEADGSRTVVVDRFEGNRLNSPNDLVYGADGSLYFTDPPYGLEGQEESPLRELDFNGIFRLRPDGELEALVRDQSRPNGIALSPDESTLYVANSDQDPKVWMAYDLDESGASNARVFYDVTDQTAPGAPDGMKVDTAGNIFATGPGGVWVFHAGRRAPGHDHARREAGQRRLGRRRPHALHDGADRPVPDCAEHRRRAARPLRRAAARLTDPRQEVHTTRCFGETLDMTEKTSLIDRVGLWVLGSTLFLYVGLLPNVLYSRYLGDGVVHRHTYGTVAVSLVLFWIYAKFNDAPTRVLTLIFGVGLLLWVWFTMPAIG